MYLSLAPSQCFSVVFPCHNFFFEYISGTLTFEKETTFTLIVCFFFFVGYTSRPLVCLFPFLLRGDILCSFYS